MPHMTENLSILLADRSHLDDLSTLLKRIESEDHPDVPAAAEAAPAGLRQSLARYDVFDSDSIWLVLAFMGTNPAGIAILIRIPKLDARQGYLYLDELHVLHPYRRRGVGRALLERSIELAAEHGLRGLRLLTRIDNAPARRLYESVGFAGNETFFYQFQFDHSPTQS